MIRVSIVSTKDLIKKSVKISCILVLLATLVYGVKFSKYKLDNIEIDTAKCMSYISEELTVMGDIDQSGIQINPELILNSELGSLKSTVATNEDSLAYEEQGDAEGERKEQNINGKQDDKQATQKNSSENNNIEVQEVNASEKTEVVKSAYKETYNYIADGVKIKNETSYNLDEQSLSSGHVKLKNKNVIIFHTHTCESYTATEQNKYVPSGNYRTLDLNHNVSRVADVLQTYLTSYGFNVVHDKTYHDYPAYTGSYGRSLKTVSNLLEKNKDTDIIIDLHRDAMSDETYAPKVKIGDEYVSQLMFVIGTNGSGLEHDNWKSNLEFAIKVQKKGNEMYPGLFRPIILRNARYNQHLGNAATIIEVGATGNTLEECEKSAKYLAKVLDEIY